MKRFACGDVVPGCVASWVCSTDDEILLLVAAHARVDHGLPGTPPELMSAIQDHIVGVG